MVTHGQKQPGLFTAEGEAPAGGPRAGVLNLPRGPVATPVFMPVGTQGSVKTVSAQELEELGFALILANTYHLELRPGSEMIARRGGLQKFMGWSGSILTDSGGFQVFSLTDLCRVSEEGVRFASHLDGTRLTLTPESAVAIQLRLGSDILMMLDECVGYPANRAKVENAMRRSLRWAARARACELPAGRFLFGIVQGGTDPGLRRESAAGTAALDFPGYAVGGLAVGEPKETMWEALAATTEALPADRPRYLMGVGEPTDLWNGVARGIDMFDCVLPTRNARNGSLFTRHGAITITNARFAEDDGPIDGGCDCLCCGHYTRAYLRHLLRAGEMLGKRLATLHNLRFLERMMTGMRAAIAAGRFDAAQREFLHDYTSGVSSPLEGKG